MIIRQYSIEKLVKPKRVLIIYGPRRVGKTTLIKNFLSKTKLKYKLDSGDNIKVRHLLTSDDFEKILEYLEGYNIYVIDEAQQIKGLGAALKIIVDNRPDLRIIATGSSSLNIAHEVGEPLTGRKKTVRLFPFSHKELLSKYNKYELKEQLDNFLIYGAYPEVVLAKSKKNKTEILLELVDSYLLKDILSYEQIKNSRMLVDLLKLLSFQVGSLVSLNEFAGILHVNVRTVSRYLDLLEKSFVIYPLTSFSRNKRSEISKKCKYYFYDTGIRNAIIRQFNPIDSRNDIGALWENFIMNERLKKREYEGFSGSFYFWKNYNHQEIDLIEEKNTNINAYEMKWSNTKSKVPGDFYNQFPETPINVINNTNYLKFIL